MDRILTRIFLIGFILGVTSARSITNTDSDGQIRRFENFGPDIKNTVVMYPDYEPDPTLTDPVEIGKKFIETFGGTKIKTRVTNSYTTKHNGITHVYYKQVINDQDVCNGVGNVNIDKKGQIINSADCFYRGDTRSIDQSDEEGLITAPEAVILVAKFLGVEVPSVESLQIETRDGSETITGASFAIEPIPAKRKFLQTDGGIKLHKAWHLKVQTDKNYYHIDVDRKDGAILGMHDYVADATYTVFAFGTNDPTGSRVKVTNPSHNLGSPLKWHSQGPGKDFTTTISNNAYAQNNPSGKNDYVNNYRPDGGPDLNFNFPLDLTKAPSQNIDSAITNLFYWNNLIHDLYYAYGFTETAGNFQENNLNRGGVGGDSVVAFAQDGSGTNNANFLTLPDGQKGVMRMYIFTVTTPNRDGDFDNGVVIHEYTHGLSNRLTGGPQNVDCLRNAEAGGMGEGWGDFMATILRTTSSTTRNDNFPIGVYVTGNPNGIRHYVYSTSLTTNPTTYGYLKKTGYNEVHNAGEVWMELLWEVYWNLVDKHGFNSDWFHPQDARVKGGNMIMLQLVIDGMKLQTCNPTFVDARNAIIQADQANNKGANFCPIWRGFAKRGLGSTATAGGNENFDFPPTCR